MGEVFCVLLWVYGFFFMFIIFCVVWLVDLDVLKEIGGWLVVLCDYVVFIL